MNHFLEKKTEYGFKQQSRTASGEIIARDRTHVHDTTIWIFNVNLPFPTF